MNYAMSFGGVLLTFSLWMTSNSSAGCIAFHTNLRLSKFLLTDHNDQNMNIYVKFSQLQIDERQFKSYGLITFETLKASSNLLFPKLHISK